MVESSQDEENIRWSKLMEEGQDGSQASLKALYLEISPALLAYFNKKASYLGIPEDAVQETLLSIHRNRESYLPERSFKAWMFAIAKNRLIDQLRKRSRIERIEVLGDDYVTKSGNPALDNMKGIQEGSTGLSQDSLEAICQQESIASLQAALNKLPKKLREAIELTKLKELSVKEASEKLGINESALKTRVHRGFKRLEKELKSDYEG